MGLGIMCSPIFEWACHEHKCQCHFPCFLQEPSPPHAHRALTPLSELHPSQQQGQHTVQGGWGQHKPHMQPLQQEGTNRGWGQENQRASRDLSNQRDPFASPTKTHPLSAQPPLPAPRVASQAAAATWVTEVGKGGGTQWGKGRQKGAKPSGRKPRIQPKAVHRAGKGGMQGSMAHSAEPPLIHPYPVPAEHAVAAAALARPHSTVLLQSWAPPPSAYQHMWGQVARGGAGAARASAAATVFAPLPRTAPQQAVALAAAHRIAATAGTAHTTAGTAATAGPPPPPPHPPHGQQAVNSGGNGNGETGTTGTTGTKGESSGGGATVSSGPPPLAAPGTDARHEQLFSRTAAQWRDTATWVALGRRPPSLAPVPYPSFDATGTYPTGVQGGSVQGGTGGLNPRDPTAATTEHSSLCPRASAAQVRI